MTVEMPPRFIGFIGGGFIGYENRTGELRNDSKKILVAIFAQIFNLCTIIGIIYYRKGRIRNDMEDFRRFMAKIGQNIEHKFDFCAKFCLTI